LVVVAAAVTTTGCAAVDSAGPPDGAPRTAAASIAVPTPEISVVGASPVRAPTPSCVRDAEPVPAPGPSASVVLTDREQRARRALAAQRRPTATRGVVPKDAIPGAEACIQFLRMQFSLLSAGSRTSPDPTAVEAALHSAGLTTIVVGRGPVFSASTGAACLHGDLSVPEPAFIIGPLAADGSCRA
jgi:hypothetical protein